jgi:hypothetical protein
MKYRILLVIPFAGLVIAGCEKPERSIRHYREVSMVKDDARPPEPPAISAAPLNVPPASTGPGTMGELPPEMRTPSLPLEWQTPEGWEERPGSGMRIATFMVLGNECTLMTFPGDVGGDEANIRRWLGQLGQPVDDDVLKSFVANPVRFETAGGFECRLFDYSAILPEGSPKNIIAGIITIDDHTAFVKLMGDSAVLKEQKTAFENLCKSIRLKPAQDS